MNNEIRNLLVARSEATSRINQLTPAWLRQVRQERGWTQPQLANKLDVSQTYISLFESGGREMPEYLYWKLLTLLDEQICPQCGQSTMVDVCPHCGYEKPGVAQ